MKTLGHRSHHRHPVPKLTRAPGRAASPARRGGCPRHRPSARGPLLRRPARIARPALAMVGFAAARTMSEMVHHDRTCRHSRLLVNDPDDGESKGVRRRDRRGDVVPHAAPSPVPRSRRPGRALFGFVLRGTLSITRWRIVRSPRQRPVDDPLQLDPKLLWGEPQVELLTSDGIGSAIVRMALCFVVVVDRRSAGAPAAHPADHVHPVAAALPLDDLMLAASHNRLHLSQAEGAHIQRSILVSARLSRVPLRSFRSHVCSA